MDKIILKTSAKAVFNKSARFVLVCGAGAECTVYRSEHYLRVDLILGGISLPFNKLA